MEHRLMASLGAEVFSARFLYLLVSMLGLLVIYPFFAEHSAGAEILDVVLTLVLFSGVYAISDSKVPLIVAGVLATPALLGRWLSHFYPHELVALLGYGFMIAFLAYTAFKILSHIMRTRAVTSDTIFAALCVYLLMGFGWGIGFALLEAIQPGAFSAFSDQAEPHHVLAQLIYYSLVTLTTVGYGDIVPVSAPARGFSNLESVIGQLYLTVLVARLVGVRVSAHAGTTQ